MLKYFRDAPLENKTECPALVRYISTSAIAHYRRINVREHRSGNKKMDNPEKLAIFGKQDTGRIQINQKAHHYAQENTNNIKKARALLQTTGGKD